MTNYTLFQSCEDLSGELYVFIGAEKLVKEVPGKALSSSANLYPVNAYDEF